MSTHGDRIDAANTLYSIQIATEQAHRMLRCVWERYFGEAVQKAISEDDAVEIGDIIDAIDNILFQAARDCHLETGTGMDDPGVRAYMEHADRYKIYARVSNLNDQIYEIERRKSGIERSDLTRKRVEAANLPDEEAIPALKALLREVRA